jgi:hypothetical protein
VFVLQRSWEPIRAELAAFSARYGRRSCSPRRAPRARRAPPTRPNGWMLSRTPNQTEQAAAYQSLLATFSDEAWWEDVYRWVRTTCRTSETTLAKVTQMWTDSEITCQRS